MTRTAVDNAEQLVANVRGIREYYAVNVVDKVVQGQHFHVAIDHAETANAIPPPATFLMEMMAPEQGHIVTTALTSPFPFQKRAERQLDTFQQRAWQAVKADPDQLYVELSEMDGHQVVRAAKADRMTRQACVDCHNSHPDSMRTDWQLGDVRGLLEVNTNVDGQLERGLLISRALTVVTLLAFALIMLVNFLTARRVTGPLKSITASLRTLSQGKPAQAVCDCSDYEEVRELADAFESFSEKEAERKALADQVEQLAYFDRLTGLPNRTRFQQRLSELMKQCEDQCCSATAFLIDIDHFNDLNDTMGYQAADRVLCQLAERMVAAVPDDVLIARIGEDTFGAALTTDSSTDIESTRPLMEQIRAAIAEPLCFEERLLHLTTSIGAASSCHEARDAEELMLRANVALKRAKEDGRDRVVIHSPTLTESATQRVELVRALNQALERQEFVPFFQPQFDLQTGRLIGAEALLRWRKPDGTLVPPGVFIPVAEQSRLIVPMGAQILRSSCEHCLQWQQQGLTGLRVAVNVSGVQFAEDDLICLTRSVLEDTGLAPELLELEVTESATLADIGQVIDTLSELHELGIELALDDFGTGYSSLSYLKKLPVDRLKIDREFVRDLLNNPDDQAILGMIVSLGEALGLKILAEGVEEEAQLALLRRSGCLEAQGFYYARPLPPDEFVDFARDYQKEWQAKQSVEAELD